MLVGRLLDVPTFTPALYLGMWRVQWPDGRLSDMTNLTRAKDAAACFMETGASPAWAAEPIRRPPVRQNRIHESRSGNGNRR